MGNHKIILRVDCVDRIEAETILPEVLLENVQVLAEAAHEIGI